MKGQKVFIEGKNGNLYVDITKIKIDHDGVTYTVADILLKLLELEKEVRDIEVEAL
jgi:archaellum component FlaC